MRFQVQAFRQLTQFQFLEQRVGVRPRGLAEIRFRRKVDGHVGLDSRQPVGMPRAFFPRRQFLDDARFRVDVGQSAVQFLNRPVLLNQRGGGLFAHARDARDIVGGVAHERL